MNAIGGTDALHERRRSANVLWVAVILGSLTLLFYPTVSTHIANAGNPWFLNDDAQQQIWPFLRYHDSRLFQNDYLADYQLQVDPVGYRWFYQLAARWVDPRVLSKVLPYALLATMLAAVGLAAWRLGGPAAAWCSLALCLSTDSFLAAMTGGLPRAFGFPLTAIAAAALVFGRPYLLAIVVCLGAAFYYSIGVLAGVMLALYLLLPKNWGVAPHGWSLRHRFVVVATTAALSVLIILPNLHGLSSFGASLGPDDWVEYPEAGLGGRLGEEDVLSRPPLYRVFSSAWLWTTKPLASTDAPWSWRARLFKEKYHETLLIAIASILTISYILHARGMPSARRVMLLPLAGVVTYLLAWTLIPHLYVPERYTKFSMAIASIVMLPAGLLWVCSYFRAIKSNRVTYAAATASICIALLLFGGRGTTSAGFTVQIPTSRKPLYDYLAGIPSGALIAGWPSTMDAIPYLSGRRVLMTRETHLPFHEEYVKEMRRRMEAIVAAYFAQDAAPITYLRDVFGVTHFLIDKRHYDQPPTYFAPAERLASRVSENMVATPETLRLADTIAVFRDENFLVLDLNMMQQ